MLRQFLLAAATTCLMLFTLGCGNGTTIVTGNVVFGTYKMSPGDKIVVMLQAGEKAFSIEAADDGKFSIPNVPTGTYKVQAMHYTSTAAATALGKGKPDGGRSSPVPYDYQELWTVPGGPFTLDLSKMKM